MTNAGTQQINLANILFNAAQKVRFAITMIIVNTKSHHLRKRLKYEEHDKPIIIIGMGTCGLASGAAKVKEAIEAELKKLNIEAIIEGTGCIGYCAVEPIVDIKLPGKDRISYQEITVKDVPRFIKTL